VIGVPGFFEDDVTFTGAPLTDGMVRAAEESLGYRLPLSYVGLLRERNGGVPRRCCFPTPFRTSWAPGHIEIDAILGIGECDWGVDAEMGSAYLVPEWGYPDVGVVICATPSGGHDTVMLDYRGCGPQGEPAVVHVDEDRVPRQIAGDFQEFIDGLVAGPGE
jgi:hypothetical protein